MLGVGDEEEDEEEEEELNLFDEDLRDRRGLKAERIVSELDRKG
jgi:hypothetical protein